MIYIFATQSRRHLAAKYRHDISQCELFAAGDTSAIENPSQSSHRKNTDRSETYEPATQALCNLLSQGQEPRVSSIALP